MSPYGRIVRIVRQEKRLEERVPLTVLKTRGEENPYYELIPSGRVPALVLDDGRILEESGLICWYLDHLDDAPTLHPPEGLEGLSHRRIEAVARSMLDGLSLWGREYIYRDKAIRSPMILAHEKARAERLADFFESEVTGDVMSGPLNMAQITLACALHGRPKDRPAGYDWRANRPNLTDWVERIGQIQSVADSNIPAELT